MYNRFYKAYSCLGFYFHFFFKYLNRRNEEMATCIFEVLLAQTAIPSSNISPQFIFTSVDFIVQTFAWSW